MAPEPDEAIAQALADPDPRPVVLLDVGDNVGAGTPGDSAILLEALIRRGVPSFLCSIWDADAVRATATVGARVDLEVGGRSDPLYGPPVRIVGTTRAVGQDAWEDRRSSGGWVSFDAGLATVVDLDGGGTVKGNLIGIDPNPEKIKFGMPVDVVYKDALGRKDREGNSYISYFFQARA
jgi:microcystin degradation protein MlrC